MVCFDFYLWELEGGECERKRKRQNAKEREKWRGKSQIKQFKINFLD